MKQTEILYASENGVTVEASEQVINNECLDVIQ